MSKNGISFNGPIISDEKIHRFSCDSNKSKKDEWYVAYNHFDLNEKEHLSCVYGSWSISQTKDNKYVFKSWENDKGYPIKDLPQKNGSH
jgi:hypothetical protein